MSGPPASFLPTRWSLVLRAGRDRGSDGVRALSELCEAYWPPLYASLRRSGLGREEAEDVTQDFFRVLLERDDLAVADPGRGRFRSFLLTAMQNFLANERRRETALKRGGGATVLSLDFASAETRFVDGRGSEDDLDHAFARDWALHLLDRSVQLLRAEYDDRGRSALFEELRAFLSPGELPPLREVAERLDLSEAATKVAIHRLRRRYRDTLRGAIRETVDDAEAVDEEIRDLFGALGSD